MQSRYISFLGHPLSEDEKSSLYSALEDCDVRLKIAARGASFFGISYILQEKHFILSILNGEHECDASV